jgi:hypothetical protein
MAITRTQYITVAELNEILGVSTYIEADKIKIYEASEVMKYHMRDNYNSYDTLNAPLNLKLATAYQVLFNEENDDNSYDSDSFTIGKFSASQGNTAGKDGYFKISPKSRRYLVDGGLTRRVL